MLFVNTKCFLSSLNCFITGCFYLNLIKIFSENSLIFRIFLFKKFQIKRIKILVQLFKIKVSFIVCFYFLMPFTYTKEKSRSLKFQVLNLQIYWGKKKKKKKTKQFSLRYVNF